MRTDDGCPSLFDERFRDLHIADEERFERGDDTTDWPRWLRRDIRVFITDYLKAHGVSQRALGRTLGRSVGFISGFLNPKRSGARFRWHTVTGTELEVLLDLLELPSVESQLLRDLFCLEDARRREAAHADRFRRRIDTAWRWQTNTLAQDQIIKYARSLRNVLVCEMTLLDGFRPDPRWLRNHMAYPFDGQISEAEIARAWRSAVEMGLVEQTPDGWRPAQGYEEKILRSGTPRLREALKRYYLALIEASKGGLQLDSQRRYYEGRTLCVAADALGRIGEQMHELLAELPEASPGEGEAVVHVQMTAFTLADINGRPEELPPMRSGDAPPDHQGEET